MKLVWVCLLLSLVHAGFCMHRGPKNQPLEIQESDLDPDSEVDTVVEDQQPEESENKSTKEKIIASLKSLRRKVQRLPANAPALVGSIVKLISEAEKLSNQDVGNDIAQVLKVTTALQSNWTLITGDDVAAMGKAICDVLAVVTLFIPPPYGTIISCVVGVIGNLIGTKAGKPKPMSEVVRAVMQEELLKQHTFEMTGKVRGALSALDKYQYFLNGFFINNETLSDRNFQVMITQYDIFKLFELREELMTLIERMASSKKKEDAADTIKLINSYVVISSMTEVLIHTMKSILERDEDTMLAANAYSYTIEQSRQESQQKLWFLRNPKQEHGAMFASYVPEDNPIVETYLSSVEVSAKPPKLPGCYQLANKKDERVSLKRSISIGSKDAAIFKFSALSNGVYAIVTTKDGQVCHSKVNTFLEVNKDDCSKHSKRAHFRINSFADEGFLILNKKWPTSPLWLKDMGIFDGLSKVLSVTSAEKEWSEEDPEYVWRLVEAPCDGTVLFLGQKPIQ